MAGMIFKGETLSDFIVVHQWADAASIRSAAAHHN
jgi:hypothetical protein